MKHFTRTLDIKYVLAVVLIVIALMVLSGLAQTQDSKPKSITPECRLLLSRMEATEMLENMMLLKLLRQGDTNALMETLEFEIDSKVVALYTNKKDVVIESSLRAILEYRSKNPRQKRELTDNRGFESSRDTIINKAARILGELESEQQSLQ